MFRYVIVYVLVAVVVCKYSSLELMIKKKKKCTLYKLISEYYLEKLNFFYKINKILLVFSELDKNIIKIGFPPLSTKKKKNKHARNRFVLDERSYKVTLYKN